MYFNNKKLNKEKLVKDLQGYISYYNAENDINYFAKYIDAAEKIVNVK